MRPFSDINIGDIYITTSGSMWVVLDKEGVDKMVKMQMLSNNLPYHLNKPFWKKYTDKIFTRKF